MRHLRHRDVLNILFKSAIGEGFALNIDSPLAGGTSLCDRLFGRLWGNEPSPSQNSQGNTPQHAEPTVVDVVLCKGAVVEFGSVNKRGQKKKGVTMICAPAKFTVKYHH